MRTALCKKGGGILDENGVNMLPWLVKSPDLNPIENGCSDTKRRLRMLQKYPTTGDNLCEHLCEIWNGLSDDYFIKLSHSMIRLCNAIKMLVVQANIETYIK